MQVINGKVLDPGPVLVLSFMTQELEVEVGKDSSSRTVSDHYYVIDYCYYNNRKN